MSAFEMTIPVARGVQARREYYVSAIPLRHVPRVFQFAGKDPVSEVRGRPIIDKKRVVSLAGTCSNIPLNTRFRRSSRVLMEKLSSSPLRVTQA